MEKIRKCFLCGRELQLFKKENYDRQKLGDFAFASRKIPEYMHWALYECKECRILCSVCPIEKDEIFKKYGNASYDSNNEANDASHTYIHYLKKYLPGFPRGKALDIGTGNGSYLKELRDSGVETVVGVEPSVAPVKAAENEIAQCILNEVFSEKLFEPDSFEMVSMFQTIEHIPDTEKILREIYNVVLPGGYVYIVCHDYTSVVNRMMGVKSPIYDIEHLQIFSRKSIRLALEQAGFENAIVFALRNRYPIRYWVRLFPFSYGFKKRLLGILEKLKIGNTYIAINAGNVGIIAQKPGSRFENKMCVQVSYKN